MPDKYSALTAELLPIIYGLITLPRRKAVQADEAGYLADTCAQIRAPAPDARLD